MTKEKKIAVDPDNSPTTNTSLFSVAPIGDTTKLKRRGMAPLLKPRDIPIGSAVSGTILSAKAIPSKSGKKGESMPLINMRHANGTEFCLPAGGVIRQALAPGVDGAEAVVAMINENEVGKFLTVVRKPDRMSDKYKKKMFDFDVFTD